MIKSKKLSKYKNIRHAFFNKLDGGSKDLSKNIKVVLKKIKINTQKVFLLNQIHSNKFYYIDKNTKFKTNKFKGDALITDNNKIPIGVLTADCSPILIHDHNRKMVAAIHAGWKGAFKGIVKNVIDFMLKKGCSTKNMTAVIGPCISIENYEVKKDFIKKFLKKDKKNKFFFKKIDNKNYFSLNKYINYQLKDLNIRNIEIIKKDTFNIKNNFFSARRSIRRNKNDYGRNISIIMIN